MLQSGRRARPGNFPVLQETVLGWTISGRTPDIHKNEPQHTFLVMECSNLEHTLNRFWEVELVQQSTMTAEQQACEEHFIIQLNSHMADLWLNCQLKWNPIN